MDTYQERLPPVDLGYNVEESLPNLAYYALMVNDRSCSPSWNAP